MTEKMKRDRGVFFSKKSFRTLKPARWIGPKCFKKKKKPSHELFLHSSSNLTVFSIIYMIRSRFFSQYMSNNLFVCQSYVSWRNSRSASIVETLWGSWVFIPLDQRSKTHFYLAQNGKIIDCNKSNDVPFVVLGLSTSSSTTPTPPS